VLDIRATAKIFGDVEMSKLIIEEGSFLQGYCKMKA
jgi:cytoskeletal protein CcmA (bactofilin family)